MQNESGTRLCACGLAMKMFGPTDTDLIEGVDGVITVGNVRDHRVKERLGHVDFFAPRAAGAAAQGLPLAEGEVAQGS